MLDAVPALNELGTMVSGLSSPYESAGADTEFVTVPDAHLLFTGEFKRVGTSDLKIVGQNGESFFIADYFASDKRPNLMSPQGATLSSHVVESLAGPLAPGQHAQAGAPAASAQPVIGRVDALTGSATVVRNGVTVALNVGDNVRRGDVVQTSGSSSVAIVLADGSTFSMSANARMVLDNLVFNASGSGNSGMISLVQGSFSFVAGQVAKNGEMRVETPVATMGIRGTAVSVEISASDGQTRFSVMVEPDGTTGSFNLYNKTTGALIGTVNNSQVGWVVTPAGPLQVVAQQEQKTPAQLQQELGIVQQIFTIFNNNQQNPFVPPSQEERRADNPDKANPGNAQGGGGSGTPPPGTSTTNPLADQINTVSNNPSTPPSSATVQLPTDPLPNTNPPPPPVVTVTVSANRPPIAVDDPDGTPDGGGVIDNDSDPEGSIIVVRSAQHVDPVEGTPIGPVVTVDADGEQVEGTYGTLTLRADGTYSFVPHGEAYEALSATDAVIESFEYTIADPFGETATATLSITLTGENDAPVVSGAVTGTATEDGAAVTLDALANASDVDAGTTLSVVDVPPALPAGVTFDSETGTFTLDPSHAAYQSLAAGQQITVTVDYAASDGIVSTPASVSWTVTGTNDAPVANNDTAEMNENDILFVDVLANDAQGATTTKILKSLGAVTIDGPDDVVLGTPAIVIENNQIRVTPGTAFDALAAGETATIVVPYSMQTGAGEVLTATATITVTGTNDAPYFELLPSGMESLGTLQQSSFGGVDALRLTTEGASQSQIETFLGLNAGALDALEQDTTDGAAVAFDLVLTVGETVSFSWTFASTEYTPFNDYAFVSVASNFTQKLSDISAIGDGANDGFLHSSGWQQFTYTATEAAEYRFGVGVMNEGDTAFDSFLYISGFSGIGFRRTTTEDSGLETFDLLNGALDPDTNDILSAINVVAAGTTDLGVAIDVTGAVSINGNSVTIDPTFFSSLDDGESVTLVVSYDVSDGHTTRHNSATLVIEGADDEPDNSPPTAEAVVGAGNEDASFIPVILNGSDTDGAVESFRLLTLPENGWLYSDLSASPLDQDDLSTLLSAAGSTRTLYFKPAADWNGQTTFQFKAIDDDGSESANIATATIEVAAVNDAPETQHVSAEGAEDASSIAIALTGNDIDGTVTGFKLTSLPLHGGLSLDNFSTVLESNDLQQILSATNEVLTLHFRPDANWSGETTFGFVAVDGFGAESEAAAATINVAATPSSVAVTIHTDTGYNLEEFVPTLIEADVTSMSATQVSLHHPGDDLYFRVTAEDLTFEEHPGAGEGIEYMLTGGIITGVDIFGDAAFSQSIATLAGFGISATELQAAVDLYDENEGDASAIDAIFGAYSYDVAGGEGPDILTAGDADDEIDGGLGDDVIDGQGGNDRLTGGEGADRFMFNVGFGSDIVVDFEPGVDTIETYPELTAIVQQAITNFDELSDEDFYELFESGEQFQLDGADAVIQIGGGTLRIAGVFDGIHLQLSTNDFVLHTSYGV